MQYDRNKQKKGRQRLEGFSLNDTKAVFLLSYRNAASYTLIAQLHRLQKVKENTEYQNITIQT